MDKDLVNIVGRSHALDLLLTCQRLGAEEGRKIGFFNEVLSTDGNVVHEAEEWLLGKISCIPRNVRSNDTNIFLQYL